jgi:hypothetical protein
MPLLTSHPFLIYYVGVKMKEIEITKLNQDYFDKTIKKLRAIDSEINKTNKMLQIAFGIYLFASGFLLAVIMFDLGIMVL